MRTKINCFSSHSCECVLEKLLYSDVVLQQNQLIYLLVTSVQRTTT